MQNLAGTWQVLDVFGDVEQIRAQAPLAPVSTNLFETIGATAKAHLLTEMIPCSAGKIRRSWLLRPADTPIFQCTEEAGISPDGARE